MNRHVTVIGAGIVGVSTALRLREDGHEVTLVDRLGPAEGTSHGNAGVLACNSIIPVTVPGLLRKAPRMLFSPDGALFLKWRYLPALVPWLRRYLGHANDAQARRIAMAQLPLVGDALEDHLALARGTPAVRWITPSDYVFAYANRAAYEADQFAWGLRREAGFDWDVLEGDEARDYDPALSEGLCLARCPGHGHITDPGRYVRDLATYFTSTGGTFRRAEVRGFVRDGHRLTGVRTDGGTLPCDAAVVATGAWSKPLAGELGIDAALESERGYHVEFFTPSQLPRAPTMLASGKFVATPMDGRLRCAGLVEFGGLEAPPSEAPVAFLRRRIRELLPNFEFGETRTWMGHRPATADSLPLIGEAPDAPGVFVGFGHQHVGLTAGPKTGRLLADLVNGRRPNIDMTPYAPSRFTTGRV